MRSKTEVKRVHVRELAGGGYAAIDVGPRRSIWQRHVFQGLLIVERRPVVRREGHQPPVIATARGRTVEAVVRQLLPILQCDPAIGSALLRRGRDRSLVVKG